MPDLLHQAGPGWGPQLSSQASEATVEVVAVLQSQRFKSFDSLSISYALVLVNFQGSGEFPQLTRKGVQAQDKLSAIPSSWGR